MRYKVKNKTTGAIPHRLRRLVMYFHKHKWEITHTNKWMISTRENCRCGLIREVESEGDLEFKFWWKYSDGHKEPDERIFKHT